MRLNNYYFLLVTFIGLMPNATANDAPLIREAQSSVVIPSIFLIEEANKTPLDTSKLIKAANKQYYIDACEMLKKAISSGRSYSGYKGQDEHILSLLESDARNGILPRWVENIFIIQKDSEIVISFFARSGGWVDAGNGNLRAYYNPGYIYTIDQNTGKISTANELRTIIHANPYPILAGSGVVTDYAQKPGFIAPLNPSKDNKYYKVQTEGTDEEVNPSKPTGSQQTDGVKQTDGSKPTERTAEGEQPKGEAKRH